MILGLLSQLQRQFAHSTCLQVVMVKGQLVKVRVVVNGQLGQGQGRGQIDISLLLRQPRQVLTSFS